MSSSKCVVFEFSSEILCVGFSGEHVPRLLTQSSVMCLDNEAVLRETIRKIFIDILLVKPKDYSVLLIENIFIKSETRDQLINILFREFQVVSVAFQPNLYMAMLSSGASTGIILVVEEKHSHSMCFVDGRPLQSSMINIEHLNCSIGLVDFPHDDVILTNNSWNHDKQCFVNDLNCEVDTISEMMLESLKACNTDVRILTSSKIFVCGSGATVSGFADRICSRAVEIASHDSSFSGVSATISKLAANGGSFAPMISPFNPLWAAWIGGSIFASLSTNHAKFVKPEDLVSSCGKVLENDVVFWTAPDWLTDSVIKQ